MVRPDDDDLVSRSDVHGAASSACSSICRESGLRRVGGETAADMENGGHEVRELDVRVAVPPAHAWIELAGPVVVHDQRLAEKTLEQGVLVYTVRGLGCKIVAGLGGRPVIDKIWWDAECRIGQRRAEKELLQEIEGVADEIVEQRDKVGLRELVAIEPETTAGGGVPDDVSGSFLTTCILHGQSVIAAVGVSGKHDLQMTGIAPSHVAECGRLTVLDGGVDRQRNRVHGLVCLRNRVTVKDLTKSDGTAEPGECSRIKAGVGRWKPVRGVGTEAEQVRAHHKRRPCGCTFGTGIVEYGPGESVDCLLQGGRLCIEIVGGSAQAKQILSEHKKRRTEFERSLIDLLAEGHDGAKHADEDHAILPPGLYGIQWVHGGSTANQVSTRHPSRLRSTHTSSDRRAQRTSRVETSSSFSAVSAT
jgi:hypothetical protein